MEETTRGYSVTLYPRVCLFIHLMKIVSSLFMKTLQTVLGMMLPTRLVGRQVLQRRHPSPHKRGTHKKSRGYTQHLRSQNESFVHQTMVDESAELIVSLKYQIK